MSIYKGDKLVAGKGSKGPNIPDWGHATKLTANTLYFDGFIAPGNGIVAGSFTLKNNTAVLDCMIEGVTVAQAITSSSVVSCTSNIQCPICQGNELLLNTREGNLTISNITTEMYFIPYKAQ